MPFNKFSLRQSNPYLFTFVPLMKSLINSINNIRINCFLSSTTNQLYIHLLLPISSQLFILLQSYVELCTTMIGLSRLHCNLSSVVHICLCGYLNYYILIWITNSIIFSLQSIYIYIYTMLIISILSTTYSTNLTRTH